MMSVLKVLIIQFLGILLDYSMTKPLTSLDK